MGTFVIIYWVLQGRRLDYRVRCDRTRGYRGRSAPKVPVRLACADGLVYLPSSRIN